MTDRISLLIKAKNLSSAQFADEIGVQRSSISHLMSGRNKPSLDLIQKTLQRFPEVSTEWLLFGKGEMVRELNLFDSQARSARPQQYEKLDSGFDTMLPNREKEFSLFTAQSQEVHPDKDALDANDAETVQQTTQETLAQPVPLLSENAKSPDARKEQGEDSNQIFRKSNKKESTIDKIIILYDDRTFITYLPGN